MAQLTHSDLVEFGQLLGYSSISGGICQGFSGMLMQAILVGKEDQFWKRIKLIEKYQSNFSLLINMIDAVKLKAIAKQELSEDDIELLELIAFYDGIKLYLRPDTHQEVFDNRCMSQNNLNDIYALTHPEKLKQNDFTILLHQLYALKRSDLKKYLNDLETELSIHPNLPILIRGAKHSVLLKYNRHNVENPWMYVDINDDPKSNNYYRELNSHALVHALFDSLSEHYEHILFSSTLVAPSTHPLNEASALANLKNQYKISPEQAIMYDESGTGLLFIACNQDNIEAIKLLLTHKDIEINKAMQDGCTPLFMACQQGQTEVIKLLLAQEGIEINQTDNNGCTPLFMACQQGHTEAVKLLLAKEGIAINTTTNGYSPLHIACYKGHVEIMKLLLAQEGIEIRTSTVLHLARNKPASLKAILECAILSDLRLNKAIESSGKTQLTPELTYDLLKLQQFHQDKIRKENDKNYGTEYNQSIHRFYERALEIRLSGAPIKTQAQNIVTSA
ncbi:ankyrin repeat domain-containing protein [uncultured Legionella sp.]|uniref:ankyrin repeat domain-containing protein n=1 Tax=uncultured Legionella sp. TaxID=210934 RepID=UPI0026392685|nr:ankyrin repeat domain-containing protein [uncultured Legionella sp.]